MKDTKRWKEFEKWRFENYHINSEGWEFAYSDFLAQQGYYLEFLRSRGIEIDVRGEHKEGQQTMYVFEVWKRQKPISEIRWSYNEGLKQAIEKAMNL